MISGDAVTPRILTKSFDLRLSADQPKERLLKSEVWTSESYLFG